MRNEEPNFPLSTEKVLCIIPVPLLRWILVGLALGFSGFFLLTNIYPVLATVRHTLFWRTIRSAHANETDCTG